MQLILDDENAVDETMATFDESLKERANGVSAEVNECNGNKENVENVNSKDILCDEFEATTDIATSETSEVAKDANDVENSPNDTDITLTDSRLDNNEIKEINFHSITELDKRGEPCENMTDLVKEDLLNIVEHGLAEDKETENCERTANIENSKNVENDNVVDEKFKIDGTDVKPIDQEKSEDVSYEEMDVDENASIEEVSEKTENQLQNVPNNISTELSASCHDMNHGMQEDSHDVSMAEEVSLPKSVDEKSEITAALEPKDEGIVFNNCIVDEKAPASAKENTNENTQTEDSTEIIEITSTSKLNETEKKVLESEAIKDLNVIELSNTESSSSTKAQDIQEDETKDNENVKINATSSVVNAAKNGFFNEADGVTPDINEGEDNNVSKKLPISNEVIENTDQSHANQVEFKNDAPEEKNEEVDSETTIEGKSKDKCTEVVNNLEPESQSQNIKTTAEKIQNEEFEASNTPALKDVTENTTVNTDGTFKSKDETTTTRKIPIRTSRLSNTLDILSDDEDDNKSNDPEPIPPKTNEKQCISIDDDDDVLLVDDIDSNSKSEIKYNNLQTSESKLVDEINEQTIDKKLADEKNSTDTEIPNDADTKEKCSSPRVHEKMEEDITKEKPFVPENFLKTCKKSVAEMTREELEEFCVLRIVESVLDKSSLNDIKTKLKTMTQNIEEYKKKAMLLSKQNRDLQVVLKSVQEELKKNTNSAITPLKITRSVGMQVLMVDKGVRKKGMSQVQQPITNPNSNIKTRNTNNNKPQNVAPSQPIPVPRLVPAQNTQKTSAQVNNQKIMPVNNGPTSTKKTPAVTKVAEKRPRTSSQSVTVDLTDDEPPAKANRNAVTPVRLVNQQSLMASRPNTPQGASPRKVFIPISPQAQAVRPGQAIMLRPPAPISNTAVRGPNAMRMRMPNSVRVMRMNNYRHPAPLPDHVKQYQPPNWKALPPAPDLKLSKVENGIVISWKIDGYQEDLYEEIASYQLYAYQETSVAPSTSLWKKIGDVKALPLPMACTLTQFMTGYKYYFAVRAVDIRSRVGPFSLPGSILLLNKV